MKYALFLSHFNKTWIFSTDFLKKFQILDVTKIGPLGSELFNADEQTDMMNLIVAVRNFAKALIKGYKLKSCLNKICEICFIDICYKWVKWPLPLFLCMLNMIDVNYWSIWMDQICWSWNSSNTGDSFWKKLSLYVCMPHMKSHSGGQNLLRSLRETTVRVTKPKQLQEPQGVQKPSAGGYSWCATSLNRKNRKILSTKKCNWYKPPKESVSSCLE
jgi:hypothetical protein